MVYKVSDHIRGTCSFKYYRDNCLWYETDTGFKFPVPTADLGTATAGDYEKSIFFMRWIRRYIEDINDAL